MKVTWMIAMMILSSGTASAQQPLSDRSKSLVADGIERERSQLMQDPKARPLTEAISAVQETQNAVQLLEQEKVKPARAALDRALAKIELILSSRPDLALVPVAADVRIVDTELTDEATLKTITKEARRLVADGRLQAARMLMRDLASEIEATTVNIPIATYPATIRTANGLLEANKIPEARNQLLGALQSLVVGERIVPLPVIRAQALTDEVSRQASQKKIDKAQAKQLLEDAEGQLTWAEKLGYGTKREDFSEVRASINDLKKSINRDEEPTTYLSKLKTGLQSLKERLSKPSSVT